MPRILPTRPNVAFLKHQARAVLNDYKAGDSNARRRFEQYLPAIVSRSLTRHIPRRIVLAHALAVVAREYGFTSWLQLRHHIKTMALEKQRQAHVVITDDRRQRRHAAQLRITQLAERVVTAARQQQLDRLFAAFAIPARDIVALRAYLVEHQQYKVVIDALLLSVVHVNARVRFCGAQLMDHFADERCAEPLRRLLYDSVPRVRWAALHSLQCAACKITTLTPAKDVIATVIDLALHDASIKVRRVATYELGQVGADPRVVATLGVILAQTKDRAILRYARTGLARHVDARTD